MPDFISLRTLADDCDVSESTARRWVEQEELLYSATVRRNETLFIGSAAMEEFIESWNEN